MSSKITSAASGSGGTTTAANGGTGQTTYTKGDLLASPGGATLNKLAVGTDAQVLTADAASTNGVKWATAASVDTTITKTQTVAATTNFATITLSGAIDGANGDLFVSIVADDGVETSTIVIRQEFTLAKGATGTSAGLTTASTATRANGRSNVVVFSQTNPTVAIAVAGAVCTFSVTPVDFVGTQANATIKVTIRDYTGHTITAL